MLGSPIYRHPQGQVSDLDHIIHVVPARNALFIHLDDLARAIRPVDDLIPYLKGHENPLF
jgi:hypothetical protein